MQCCNYYVHVHMSVLGNCGLSVHGCVCFTPGIFDDDFIEERKKGLEEFVNK